VTDNHQTFFRIFLEQTFEMVESESRGKEFICLALYFEMFRRNLGGLRCAWERAGYNQSGPRFDTRKKLRNFVHFLFAALGQRPFVVGFFPVRPIGFAMSEKVKVHVDLVSGS
jgi:hypothetical protein